MGLVITWTNAGLLSIGPLGSKFSKIRMKIHFFSFKKMHLKTSSAKWGPFCPGEDELMLIKVNLLSSHSPSIIWALHTYQVIRRTFLGKTCCSDISKFKRFYSSKSHLMHNMFMMGSVPITIPDSRETGFPTTENWTLHRKPYNVNDSLDGS